MRCETRRRRALAACLRGVGCETDMCGPTQAATLHEGVRHVIEQAEAHGSATGSSLRVHGTAEGCTTHVVCVACIVYPSARCVVQVGRAVHLFGSCCGECRAGRAGYWRRRQVRILSAWAVANSCECQNNGRLERLAGGGGEKKMRHKRHWWGTRLNRQALRLHLGWRMPLGSNLSRE